MEELVTIEVSAKRVVDTFTITKNNVDIELCKILTPDGMTFLKAANEVTANSMDESKVYITYKPNQKIKCEKSVKTEEGYSKEVVEMSPEDLKQLYESEKYISIKLDYNKLHFGLNKYADTRPFVSVTKENYFAIFPEDNVDVSRKDENIATLKLKKDEAINLTYCNNHNGERKSLICSPARFKEIAEAKEQLVTIEVSAKRVVDRFTITKNNVDIELCKILMPNGMSFLTASNQIMTENADLNGKVFITYKPNQKIKCEKSVKTEEGYSKEVVQMSPEEIKNMYDNERAGHQRDNETKVESKKIK